MSRHKREADIKEEYDKYRKKINESYDLAYKGTGYDTLNTYYQELKSLYSTIKKDTNLTLHFADAQALSDTATFASINSQNITFGGLDVSLDSDDFVRKLKHYLGDKSVKKEEQEEQEVDNPEYVNLNEEKFNSFSWLKLGRLYYKTSHKSIPMEFLNGPLYAEKKIINRTKVVDDTKNLTKTTAQNIVAEDLDNDENQNTATLVKSVLSSFRSKQGGNKVAVNFFKFFIDPNSFSQSVENLFFASFLIRDGRLKLFKDSNGVPMVQDLDPETRERTISEMKTTNSHHIASFDYETWKGLIETYDITESYLGHRDIEDDAWDSKDDDVLDDEVENTVEPEVEDELESESD